MTDALSFFADEGLKQTVKGDFFDLGKSVAGKETTKELYIKNNTIHDVSVQAEVEGDSDVTIGEKEFKVTAKTTYKLEIKAKPKLTRAKALKFKIAFKADYEIT